VYIYAYNVYIYIGINDYTYKVHPVLIEGNLEVTLSTILTHGKAEVGRVKEEKGRRKKIREGKESEKRRCRWAKR
jgi:hypothetical protein